jgi:hypothetical protein
MPDSPNRRLPQLRYCSSSFRLLGQTQRGRPAGGKCKTRGNRLIDAARSIAESVMCELASIMTLSKLAV